MTEDVLLDTEGAVATIRLARGSKRSALTMPMYSRLAESLAELAADPHVRVAILTGSDGSFTAGNDRCRYP